MFRSTTSARIYAYRFGQPTLTQAFSTKLPLAHAKRIPGVLKSTTLGNGVRVVSHDLDGAHTCVGVYADAGPKYDPVATPGLSYVMRFALQTSNMDSSLFQIDRTMRSTGNAYGHGEVTKRFLAWKAEGRRDMWTKPFEMLATGVVAPRFHEADIERFRDTMDNQVAEMRWQNPREYAIDQLETVAFFKEPLGAPRMVPAITNDRCNANALLEQWSALFQPQRIVVAAVNVTHEELVAAYEQLPFKHAAEAPHHARSAAPKLSHVNEAAQFYQGRVEVRYEARAAAMGTNPSMEPEVIAAIAVTAPGREESVKAYTAALVAREVYAMGIERSYAVPGVSHSGVHVFYRPYSSTGLLGYTIRCAPSEVEALLLTAAKHFPTSLADSALASAKQRATIRFVQEETELVRDYCDFIATSPAMEEFVAAIQAVSKADVEAILKKAMEQKPSCYATGDIFTFPAPAALHKH